MSFIERLPGPYWLTYLALFFLQSAISHVIAWIDGWLPIATLHPLLLLYPLWQWFPTAMITTLNSLSSWALTSLAPLLNLPEEEMHRLRYEFTTLPNRSVVMSVLLWIITYIIFMYIALGTIITTYGFGILFAVFAFVQGLFAFATSSVIYLHSVRQLLLVYRTLKRVRQFNLFRLDPIYAFSIVTSRTGVAYIILISLTLLITPIQLAPIPMLIMLVLQVALALAAFALPLRVVNQRLVAEKSRLLAELNQRVESTLAKLNGCLDQNELSEVHQLNAALAGLNTQREILAGIPTWPWRAGLLRGFLSIVVLPIILFLMQLVIQRWLQ